MKKVLMVILMFCMGICMAGNAPTIKSVKAQQRYPWNGLVDITVTVECDGNVSPLCVFAATNNATGKSVPVSSIRQIGADSFTNNLCIQHYLWNAASDIGAIKIDKLALTVDALNGGVQLWANGPYWAECNVGASQPEEYGYYFWWGDTVGYTREGGTWTDDWYYAGVKWVSSTGERMSASPFDWDSCPTMDKNTSTLQSLGYIDSTGNLVAAHDAATAHLGAPWRMPTDLEIYALTSNCTTTWETRNGVYGRLVTGKGDYASKSIFLPAAGFGGASNRYAAGSDGLYWSSTPNSDDSGYASSLLFYSSYFYWDDYSRCFGQSVRPLREFAH